MRVPNKNEYSVDGKWEHCALYERVKDALLTLPAYFKTETVISGLQATDIFTLNDALGATIEHQVVATLNGIRSVWDPNDKYSEYYFVRQSQTFPDVLLRKSGTADRTGIILGIELKGWYVLAKEGEPSYRFATSETACAPQDLIAIVPWALSNVISGTPAVYEPYIESAAYAAAYRNHHWEHVREAKSGNPADKAVILAKGVNPYPIKSDQISDKATVDGGGNFGRIARTGLMDDYIVRIKSTPLAGIQGRYWLEFFKLFQDTKLDQDLADAIKRFVVSKRRELEKLVSGEDRRIEITTTAILDKLEELLGNDSPTNSKPGSTKNK